MSGPILRFDIVRTWRTNKVANFTMSSKVWETSLATAFGNITWRIMMVHGVAWRYTVQRDLNISLSIPLFFLFSASCLEIVVMTSFSRNDHVLVASGSFLFVLRAECCREPIVKIKLGFSRGRGGRSLCASSSSEVAIIAVSPVRPIVICSLCELAESNAKLALRESMKLGEPFYGV